MSTPCIGKRGIRKEDKIKKVIEAMGELNAVEKAYLRGYFAIQIDQFEMDKRIVSYLKATQEERETLNLKLEGN